MGNKQSHMLDPSAIGDLNTFSSVENRNGVYLEKKNIPHFKIVLIGDPGVGKTSIFLRYIRNQFHYDYRKTRKVCIENVIKTVNIPQKSISSVTLWDVPGSEDLDMRASYFRNVDAAIVVVDMNDKDSIELAGSWKQDFVNKASRAKFVSHKLANGSSVTKLEELPCDPKSIPVLLLGNKFDLVEEEIAANEVKAKSLRFKDDLVNEEINDHFASMQEKLGLDKSNATKGKTQSSRPFSSMRTFADSDKKPKCVKVCATICLENLYKFVIDQLRCGLILFCLSFKLYAFSFWRRLKASMALLAVLWFQPSTLMAVLMTPFNPWSGVSGCTVVTLFTR